MSRVYTSTGTYPQLVPAVPIRRLVSVASGTVWIESEHAAGLGRKYIDRWLIGTNANIRNEDVSASVIDSPSWSWTQGG
jgi:hypothetical protein